MIKNNLSSLIKKANRALKSTKTLLEDGDYDGSVSRTYYAMFYSVEAVLLTKNLKFKSHGGVISALGKYFIKTNIFPIEMSRQLRNAYDKRQIGDYDFFINIPKSEAKKILKNGQSFINEIIKYLKKHNFI